MPSFPSSPRHLDIQIVDVHDPVHSFSSDSGIEFTRSQVSRGRIAFALRYRTSYNGYIILRNFYMIETRGRAITFDWTFPHSHTITNEAPGAPIVITTSHEHGLVTGNQVSIVGATAQANGVHTVTVVNPTAVSLDGSSTSPGGTTGLMAPFYPKMRFRDERFPTLNRLTFGPYRDDGPQDGGGTGLFAFNLTIEEVF